ncbi:sensor histidine kinase [Paramagnetospirillum magneticum]|uniref:histidine kinase n=1 Tax=Paramagnetospirillum magneticum (strain ATCC 700264 / AMB-1) TaxID=342108 RepID=Q2W676_PARM1|nr:ATP-binding protein [Paramagnetospirillum magneticum]BAE50649.1 Signal transduction histidine kinase [Paramagnetospirillum magneticum AMB-1]
MKRRPSIGTVLMLMNLAILVLPIGGLWGLRLYESALVRQTEAELIAQGVTIAAQYRSLWRAAGGEASVLGPPLDSSLTRRPGYDEPWLPRTAGLDLAQDEALPPPPDGEPPAAAPDEAAWKAGLPLSPILREVQFETLAGVRVLDRNGIVVATTREELGLSLSSRDEVRRALAGEPVSVLRRRVKGAVAVSRSLFGHGSAVRVVVALPVIEDRRVIGVVVASRTPRSVGEVLADKRPDLLGLGLALLAAVALLALVGTLTIARPLKAVTGWAKRVAEGERDGMPPPTHPVVREVAELSEAITRMAATQERRADYIRDFAAHVSHEFKTPLATITGTVELLREHLTDMTPEDRERFLDNLESEASRLSRLVQRLLDLARADVMPAGQDGCCRPLAVIAGLAERAGLTIEIMADGDMMVRMGAEAMETVFGNLLDNACRHGGPGSRVTLALRRDDDEVVLILADDGPGISPANAGRVFTPFFTTARKEGGTGLGLSIVRSLVTAHGGAIALRPSERGARFEIRLPSV